MGQPKEEKEEKAKPKPKPQSNPVQIDPSGTMAENDKINVNMTAGSNKPPKEDKSPPVTASSVGGIQGDVGSILGPKIDTTPAKPPVIKPAPPPKKKKPSGSGITISSNTGGSNTGATISTGNVYKDPNTGSTIQTGQTVQDVKDGKYSPSVIDSTTGNFLGESSTPTQVEEKNTTLGKAEGSGMIPAGPQSTYTVPIESPQGTAAVQNLGGKITGHQGTDKKVSSPYGEGSPIGAGEGTIAAGSYVSNPATHLSSTHSA